MKFSSTIWIIIIAIGAVTVAIGNIQYNIAKDREKSEAASKKAFEILKSEMIFNLEKAKSLKDAVNKGEIDLVGLRTDSWSLVSSAGLMTQMETENLGKITNVYNSVEIVNNYSKKMLDLTFGVNAAMTSSGKFREQLLKFQAAQLDDLIKQIEPLIKI